MCRSSYLLTLTLTFMPRRCAATSIATSLAFRRPKRDRSTRRRAAVATEVRTSRSAIRMAASRFAKADVINAVNLRDLEGEAMKIVPVIKSSDLQRSLNFYTEVLDFERKWHGHE